VLALALPAVLATGTYELRLLSPDPNYFGEMTVIARSQPIHVAPAAADLVVASIATVPAQPAVGQPVAVTVTVKNQGDRAAGRFVVDFYRDRAAAPGPGIAGDVRCAMAALAPGITAPCTGTFTYGAAGTFSAWAQVDTGQTVPESSEANNVAGPRTITSVAPAGPDLVQIAVTNPPGAARPGTRFTVTDTARNEGTVTAGASTTRYYLSTDTRKNAGDFLLTGSRAVPALAPGAVSSKAVTVTIATATPPGTYVLLACADEANAVVETEEGNNCLASAGTITVALPDLVQQGVSNPSAPVRRGTAFRVSDTVFNNSLVPTPRPTTTRYYLSTDSVRSTGDTRLTGSRAVPILAASAVSSGSASVTVPSTMLPGTYVLLACADDTAAVTEASEANNCRASGTAVVVAP
jgi:subtilase family serine protease